MISSSFVQDVRIAVRGLLKTPGLTFVVVLTLAVAIGANTAIFSVVDGVLRSPLPYPDEDRIVRVAATMYATDANSGGDRGNTFSDRGYWHFVNNNHSFEEFGGYVGAAIPFPLTGEGAPRQVGVGLMTASAFEVLGVLPELGRLPTAEEDAPNGPLVVLLSHELWVSQYGADPAILGRTVQVNGTSRDVVGVMPASYDFPTPQVELWTPFQLNPASTNFGGHYIQGIARLSPGVTTEAAIADARGLVARYGELGYGPQWFESLYDGGAVVRPIRDVIVGNARDTLLIVFGTVGFVLLIACGNVANLLLVRAEGRRRENAVRMTLGSSRARLARHVLIESALLALLGGVAGVMLAHAGTSALLLMDPAGIPRLAEIEVSGAALAFTACVAVLAGMLFGVLPALASGSSKTLSALRDGGRSTTLGRHGHRTRNALVMAQVALAVVLVIAAGLMVRSFEALRSVDPGFTADNTLTFEVRPLPTKYTDADAVAQFDADVAMANVRPMRAVLGDSMSRTSFTASVLTIAGVVALFLGAVGIYGVLSYVVTQRTPEIGIRSALGASPGAVLRMVLSQGMGVAGVGVLIGLVAAVAAGRVIATQLYGVSSFDVVTLAAAAAIFLVVAAVASFLPAARAANTAPVDALRAD